MTIENLIENFENFSIDDIAVAREHILNNVDNISADMLAEFITLPRYKKLKLEIKDYIETLKLDYSKRQVIQSLIKEYAKNQNEIQEDLNKSEMNSRRNEEISDIINQFKTNPFTFSSQQVMELIEQGFKGELKEAILDIITRKPNFFPTIFVSQYLDQKIICHDDLVACGIPREIIQLINRVADKVDPGTSPIKIPAGFTEVYFWGIQGSGKTSALGAVLSTAEQLGYLEIAEGPGYVYMLHLKNSFSKKASIIPPRTPVETTQYLPFTLREKGESDSRSVSLIELSGEIFQCFLLINSGKTLGGDKEKAFNSVLGFLNGGNPKIHFFFIDYNKSNEKDAEGFTQSDYLNAAATYFNRRDNNLFKESTVAIYVVVTKSDEMGIDESLRKDNIPEYLSENRFKSFINSLSKKCETHSINNRRLLGIHFSLGKPYFIRLVDFDSTTSKNIIDILMRRINTSKKNILDVFNK